MNTTLRYLFGHTTLNRFLIRTSYHINEISLVSAYNVAEQRRFKGHSKWDNIRHIKAKNDQIKGAIISKFANRIRKVVRQGKSGDPKVNAQLALALKEAKLANVPADTIERSIKKGLEKKQIPERIEVCGPDNSLIVIDALINHQGEFRAALRKILRIYPGFAFLEHGKAVHAFEEKGIVRIGKKDKDGNDIELDKVEEVAIEAEAEEVKEDGDKEDCYLMITQPIDHTKVRAFIEKNTNFDVRYCGTELLAMAKVEVPDNTLEIIADVVEQLEQLEEVENVYNNIG